MVTGQRLAIVLAEAAEDRLIQRGITAQDLVRVIEANNLLIRAAISLGSSKGDYDGVKRMASDVMDKIVWAAYAQGFEDAADTGVRSDGSH